MNINLNRLKKYEERIEKVIEDPEKIIQIIKRILEMGCTDTDGSWMVNPPILEEQKVDFWEFVKYFGNNLIEETEKRGRDIEEIKKSMGIEEMEERIRMIDGFSNYTLPEGIVIKYR